MALQSPGSASGGEIADELTNAVDRGVGSDAVGHEVQIHSPLSEVDFTFLWLLKPNKK